VTRTKGELEEENAQEFQRVLATLNRLMVEKGGQAFGWDMQELLMVFWAASRSLALLQMARALRAAGGPP